MAYHHLLAERTSRMGASAIREILKVVSQPGMVSLAGGIPALESFPLALISQLTDTVLTRYGAAALQYDPTEGFGPLREALVEFLGERGIATTAGDVLVSSGSQGMLDAAGMVLISKGDRVAVESPTYLGALQAFAPYEPVYDCLQTDDDGLIPASLEQILRQGKTKFVYLVPTFQNPTGRTIPLERRHVIAQLLQQYNALLVEDDPYGALRYDGDPLPPIKVLAPDHVVYISTLSKVFAPGLRIGFCVAPETIRRWLVIVKQGIDLHTSTYNQALAAAYIQGGHLKQHLPTIIDLYRPRQQAMLKAMERFFPPGMHWSKPKGGMFIWAQGPEGLDMEPVYNQAVKRNVAFVPGKYFYAEHEKGENTMRLNYTMAEPHTLEAAIRKLGEVIGAVWG